MNSIDKVKAKIMAQNFLLNYDPCSKEFREDAVIMDEATVEKPYGWIFIFQSKRYLETQNPLEAFGGNSPIFVNKHTGEITLLGTATSLEASIKLLENENGWDKC